ncbi:DegT/DnrJ/EryC1/StrS family aminotransferase [Mesorhizobium sp. ES1-1]|uniref:DegT/DnrJ/EryC1/StrS family aminotransferase n=1 Tax=Mesorhizobium sp. ES1-1 TaxID=2876629 RepID=UPI001CCC926A|nr:DegT/DnrJ/EryC1/StrS family aminotransferase [Mesorhizobium sp. ES1-1]MBZ9674726.1 DegT/DnrJ/EryC1/StrS family aminotransferase [Mesorhizobium sp. ES1-1]
MEFIDLRTQQVAIKDDLDHRIAKVLAHGQYIMGPEVLELEKLLADYVGVSDCVTVASGTEGLLIALMALGIGPGDEVITSPFTFIATAEAIVLVGATPVFVDVNPLTCNIEPSLIEQHITPATKAIIPVSLYGQPADMREINRIAARHGLPVIEDAAQSFGATYNGGRSCGLTTVGVTSFFPSKPLGCYGDGGAVFTNDDELARAIREIRIHGQSARYVHTRVGVGGRMDTLQCAILLAKWRRFDWELRSRSSIAESYRTRINSEVMGAGELAASEACRPLPGVRILPSVLNCTSVYAQFTILTPERDEAVRQLKLAGIPTAVHYPAPINEQPAYASASSGNEITPVSSWLAKHVLSIPMGPDLSEDDQEAVVASLARLAASPKFVL